MRRGALLLAALVLAGCGGGQETDRPSPRPVALEGAYTDARGQRREVDATLTLLALRAPTGRLPVTLPGGTAAVIADVEVEDRGPDAFPLEWAVFSARTREGRTLREQLRLPPRRLREGVRLVPVGFAVPEGEEVADVRVRSIVDLWPFRATLAPPRQPS